MSDPDMPPLPRSMRARNLRRRLSAFAKDNVPRALRRWNRAWKIVEGPFRELTAVLEKWVEERADLPEVERAVRGVIEAWFEAAREWERAGYPKLLEEMARSRPSACLALGAREVFRARHGRDPEPGDPDDNKRFVDALSTFQRLVRHGDIEPFLQDEVVAGRAELHGVDARGRIVYAALPKPEGEQPDSRRERGQ